MFLDVGANEALNAVRKGRGACERQAPLAMEGAAAPGSARDVSSQPM